MNMNKEYRAEIKILNGAERKIRRELSAHTKATVKQIRLLERNSVRAEKRCDRELQRINKRRAILEGRLH